MTLSVSWSGLKRWEECGQRHLRVMQGKSIAAKDGRVFIQGTVADRIMRAWLSQPSQSPGEMVAMAEDYVRRLSMPDQDDAHEDAQVVRWRGDPLTDRQLVTNFVREVVSELEPILEKYVLPHDYQPELSFRTPIFVPYLDGNMTAVEMIGGIDIVVRERDTGDYVLYDLKATKNPAYLNTVAGQAIFYDIAFGNWIGDQKQPIKFGFIAPAVKEKVVWAHITDDDRRVMMTRIVRFCQGQWRKEWDPKKANSGCSECEVRHACVKWTVSSVKDSQEQNRASFMETARARRTGKA